ncbi:hypothetical protein ACYSNX_12470 [Myroides sp. LJL115]
MKSFNENTGMPKFILAIFIVQFIVFLLFSLNNKEDKSLIYFATGILLIGIFLAFTKLVLKINKNSIVYKFTPFTSNKISWEDVKTIELVKLSALSDFLGWGIRYSRKYGWGYITNSEYGLFIEKHNGKKVTISVKDKDKLELFLTQNKLINPLHNIV